MFLRNTLRPLGLLPLVYLRRAGVMGGAAGSEAVHVRAAVAAAGRTTANQGSVWEARASRVNQMRMVSSSTSRLHALNCPKVRIQKANKLHARMPSKSGWLALDGPCLNWKTN